MLCERKLIFLEGPQNRGSSFAPTRKKFQQLNQLNMRNSFPGELPTINFQFSFLTAHS